MKEVEFIFGHHIKLKVQVVVFVTNIFGLSVHTYSKDLCTNGIHTREKLFLRLRYERALTESLFSTFIQSSSSSNEEIYCFPKK